MPFNQLTVPSMSTTHPTATTSSNTRIVQGTTVGRPSVGLYGATTSSSMIRSPTITSHTSLIAGLVYMHRKEAATQAILQRDEIAKHYDELREKYLKLEEEVKILRQKSAETAGESGANRNRLVSFSDCL